MDQAYSENGSEKPNAFELQKFFFYFQPAAVTGECPVGPDDSVTRNNDRDGVTVIGLAHGAKSVWASNFPGQFGVRTRLAVRNAAQSIPAFLLEVSADQVEFEIKIAQLAAKIGSDFFHVRSQVGRRFDPDFVPGRCRQLAAMKLQAAQSAIRRREKQSSSRRVHQRVVDGFEIGHEEMVTASRPCFVKFP